MKPLDALRHDAGFGRIPVVIGLGIAFLFVSFLVFASAAQSRTYNENLTQKHALLTSIREDAAVIAAAKSKDIKITGEDLSRLMPAAGMANMGMAAMCGTVTPEKNHNIIKERKE